MADAFFQAGGENPQFRVLPPVRPVPQAVPELVRDQHIQMRNFVAYYDPEDATVRQQRRQERYLYHDDNGDLVDGGNLYELRLDYVIDAIEDARDAQPTIDLIDEPEQVDAVIAGDEDEEEVFVENVAVVEPPLVDVDLFVGWPGF